MLFHLNRTNAKEWNSLCPKLVVKKLPLYKYWDWTISCLKEKYHRRSQSTSMYTKCIPLYCKIDQQGLQILSYWFFLSGPEDIKLWFIHIYIHLKRSSRNLKWKYMYYLKKWKVLKIKLKSLPVEIWRPTMAASYGPWWLDLDGERLWSLHIHYNMVKKKKPMFRLLQIQHMHMKDHREFWN